jgi:hypothetical protein
MVMPLSLCPLLCAVLPLTLPVPPLLPPAGFVDKAKELGLEGLEEKAKSIANVSGALCNTQTRIGTI